MAKIAFVLADDYEDAEFDEPYDALLAAGHQIDVIGMATGQVDGKQDGTAMVDLIACTADPADYDALVIPGGYSPDHLRTDDHVVAFTRKLAERQVPVAAVCHGPSLLIEAGVVQGRTLTSFPSIRTDLINAGATVVDEEVCVDGNLITSRNPDDLAAFTGAILAALGSATGDGYTPGGDPAPDPDPETPGGTAAMHHPPAVG